MTSIYLPPLAPFFPFTVLLPPPADTGPSRSSILLAVLMFDAGRGGGARPLATAASDGGAAPGVAWVGGVPAPPVARGDDTTGPLMPPEEEGLPDSKGD